MPELPEVETLKRELDKILPGLKIKNTQIFWPKAVSPLSPEEFTKQIKNKKIVEVRRRAKMLFLDLEDKFTLAVHLKMTGQLIFVPPTTVIKKLPMTVVGGHIRIIFEFTDRSKLYFNDLRKFGWVRLINDEEMKTIVGKVGPEPLSPVFTSSILAEIFKKYPDKTIKQILLDQTLIAGIGNIYADESCFLSKLKPDRKVKTLKPDQIKNLRDNIIKVLKLSIQKKGTSSRDYRRSDGSLGGFVPYLKVYGRTGKPCKICKKPIQKIRHVGRGTHFCPHCQK